MNSITRDPGRELSDVAVPRQLSVRFLPVGAQTVVAVVDGELDLYTAPLLEATLLPLPAKGVRRIVVDARGLRFCDVCGFRSLSEINDMVAGHGSELVIARPNRGLRRIATLVQELYPAARSQPIRIQP
ncbi:STAS domain-containing protein [Herbidospora sp. NEAU-GS84]|uniref:STAS domain-containing protein n=1 Tax=Herbidospora solisilvae TaxID=2696284 RepID=A0A7C9JBR0_9ACTN|nr:STAS domain-containing protein [Herbidospora solisilvae]NAS22101.1 STAS domain-containing protein [Herbidospora solisilvae]